MGKGDIDGCCKALFAKKPNKLFKSTFNLFLSPEILVRINVNWEKYKQNFGKYINLVSTTTLEL